MALSLLGSTPMLSPFTTGTILSAATGTGIVALLRKLRTLSPFVFNSVCAENAVRSLSGLSLQMSPQVLAGLPMIIAFPVSGCNIGNYERIWSNPRYMKSARRVVPGLFDQFRRSYVSTASSVAQVHSTDQAKPGNQHSKAEARKVLVKINGREVEVFSNLTLLEACHQLGIQVPTLCSHQRLQQACGAAPPGTAGGAPGGTCRLCLLETGNGQLKPACTTPVSAGLEVRTDSPAVRDNIQSVLGLLKANHPDDCMACDANGQCEFQALLNRYKVVGLPKMKLMSEEWRQHVAADAAAREDTSSAALAVELDKCVKCGRCVAACGAQQDMNVLGMLYRGRQRRPGKLEDWPLDFTKCIACGQCAVVCPTAAIHERSQWREVLDLLEGGRQHVVAQVAPAVRVAVGEELGLAPGTVTTGQMVAALKFLGFSAVFDTNFSADLTIMEEGTELLGRLQAKWSAEAEGREAAVALPLFTSCCPAWINAVEKSYPELIPHLSTCKSPQMMLGALIKRHWAAAEGVDLQRLVSVSIMPCTAKKHEASLPHFSSPAGGQDVDYVLTTRELGHMLRHRRLPLNDLPAADFDSPLGSSTGAAALFGASGGVTEAAVRSVYALTTGQEMPRLKLEAVRGLQGVKEAEVQLPDPQGRLHPVRIAVASGIANAHTLLERLRQGQAHYEFVEVMACPGGCINGGGQPKSSDPLAVLKRMHAIYAIDEGAAIRQSHLNPEVQQLYQGFLGAPGSATAHALLHTKYRDLSHDTTPPYSHTERTRDSEHSMAAAHAPLSKSG